jgi:type I restriction-modification system DNA methylase subunit
MLKNKNYTCEICKTKPDQLSHHKTHLDTQKHKDKKELFELKLSKLSSQELKKLYNTTDISIIVDENETSSFFLKKKDNITSECELKPPSNETNICVPIEDNKKLININSTYKDDDINNKEMSDDEKQKIELSNNVSNKEALKDKIHEIHNYLRNNGAGYGMNALKVFNLLYGLKKIEEKKLLDKVNLKRPDCEFSYLLKIANENKDEELSDLIRDKVLDSINESPIRNLLLYEIPTSMKGHTFSYLIKEIEKITVIEKTCNVLLSGKIYEYFIGRDESAISELGAYFTDRHIVDYIYKKLDPEINEDGSINSMIDMFGGSGGFTTGYINYLNDKYDIDWKDNINKIYHFDMNEDVVKSAGLEFFCLTGVLPNMKDNLAYRNSFTDKFDNKKFMNVITNPPYGGDKVVQSEAQIKRKKIKEYIKKELLTLKDELQIKTRLRQIKKIEDQEKQDKKDSDKTKVSVEMCSQRIIKYAKDNKLTGNDKESSSLILIMDMVDVNGTAIGVLKEGVFFNKTYKDIRKCLVEKFNVREIISVPQDQFENTSTKTSIVIFDNTKEKTTKVIFSDLVVERYTEDKFEEIGGEIVLTENKDDICGISDKLISEATKDEILKNNIFSLNSKDYNKKAIVVGEGYELIKLGDKCNFLTTTKHCTNIAKSSGKFKFYNSSQNSDLYVDFCEVKDYSIILGQGGNFNIHFDKDFTPSKHVCVIQSIDKNIELLKYLYYIIPELQKFFITNGSTISWLNKTNIKDFNIPIPKSKQKITEWVNKISKPYDKKNKNEELIMKLENDAKNKVIKIIEEECDEVELDSICEFKSGKFNTCNMDNKGPYPFYNATINSIGFHSEYCFDDNKYILLIKSGNVNANGLGSVTKVKGKIACVTDVVQIKSNINIDYLCIILELIKDKIRKTSNNSVGLGHLKISEVKKLKIKIPKNKKLIKDLEPLFQEIEKLQSEMKEAESQYKQLIKELSEEAILTNNKVVVLPDNKINEDNIKVKETKKNKPKVDDEIPVSKKTVTKNKVKTKSNVI